jgi:molecular chaperone GrpE
MSEDSSVKTEPVKADATGDELAQAKREADEYLKGWQRARADYANLKRETDERLQELAGFANAELLKDLLPLVDYFKHALAAVPKEEAGSAWVEGIRHIQTKLMEVLAYHGVKELETIGEKFDPALHEAVQEEGGTDQPAGTVIAEARTGFTLHGKLLQPARVKVAR